MLFLTEPRGKSHAGRVLRGVGILVVDDSRACADTMAALFRSFGADTTVAYDGISAIQRFDSGRHRIVVLDLAMPVLSGFDVAKFIRSMPAFESTVIIALSGCEQMEYASLCAEAGINHYVRKPAEINALLALIGQLMPVVDESPSS